MLVLAAPYNLVKTFHYSLYKPLLYMDLENATFEVPRVVNMKIPVLWDAMPHSMVNQLPAHSEHFSPLMMDDAGSSKMEVHLHQITGCHSRRENLSKNTS